MIAEALKFLTDFGARAVAPAPIMTDDPRVKRFVVDGKVVELGSPPPPRDHAAGSLADLIELANRFHGDTDSLPTVWYDEAAVVLVIDDEAHRVETARITLVPSDTFRRLTELRRDPRAAWLDQRSFCRLLRVDLARSLDPGILLRLVERVKFENGEIVTGTVTKTAQSLGREITDKFSPEKDLPDQVCLTVPVYKTAGQRETYGLYCSVEVEPRECKFQLLPLPDEIERVQQLAVASVGARLHAGLTEGIPAYYGRP